MRPAAAPAAVTALLALLAGAAGAHGFDERYDLPVPLAWVVAGACAVVGLSFVAVAWSSIRRDHSHSDGRQVPMRLRMRIEAQTHARALHRRGTPQPQPQQSMAAVDVAVPHVLRNALRMLGLALFALTVASALWGTRDPLLNLAPTLVWIVWWLGMSFASALLGGVWTLLDPWRTGFALLEALARRLGRSRGLQLGWHWPPALGQWPAAALLLAWCWLEVVMPLASTPFKAGIAALAWTGVQLAGMAAFGRPAWQTHADVFAVVFATLSRLAPLRVADSDAPPAQPPRGQVAFVMAMLSTVVFDGLHGGAAWTTFEGLLRRAVPVQWLDVNGLVAGTAGLVAVWLVFGLAWRAALALSGLLLGAAPMPSAATLALALVPIALGYGVAHNLSSFVIQGQRVFALLSDPFGRQWDLFGTARWYPDIGLIDARATWLVAVAAIVLGHVASIWQSHRAVLAAGTPPRRAAIGLLPLTALMVAYTAVSLLLIGEPMVVALPP